MNYYEGILNYLPLNTVNYETTPYIFTPMEK
jgi:hypothetical protein